MTSHHSSSYVLVACAICLFAVSCSKETVEISQTGTTGRLVSAELVKSEPAAEVVDKLVSSLEIEAPTLFDIDLSEFGMKMETFRITYNTKDNRGNDIVLSGDVCFMRNPFSDGLRTIESVSLFHQAFTTSEDNNTDYEEYAFPGRSVHNALVVYPHYQGSYAGKDMEGCPVTIAELVLKARQAIDCELAALEFIEGLDGVRMACNYYTENMGISCGAGAALATQYLLENVEEWKILNRSRIRLLSTYCCEGCYSYGDLLWCLTKFYEDYKPDDLSDITSMEDFKPAALIAVLVGAYDTWKGIPDENGRDYFEGIDDVREYFSPEFLAMPLKEKNGRPVPDVIEYFRSGELGHHSRMFKMAGIKAIDMLNPELIGEDGQINRDDPRMAAMLRVLAKNDIIKDGWYPKAKLCIAHSTADEFIPYTQAVDVYNNLSVYGLNRNVTLKLIPELEHTNANIFYAIVDIVLSKHPCGCPGI